jgi:hypothetical protein
MDSVVIPTRGVILLIKAVDMEEEGKRDCPQENSFVKRKVSKVLMKLLSDGCQ